MNAPQIGIGLLGPAGIGQAHAHAYTLVRQVLWPPPAVPRLVRVSGRQMANAELTRARYGFERAGERWQELIDDPAVQAGIVHMVGYNYRFVPAVALTRRLIDEGRLGRIHHFRARFADASFLDPEAPFTWHQDAEASGSNALLDLGSHLIDLARFLVGEPAAVNGATTTFVPERTDPATGRRAHMTFELNGSGGTVTFDLERINSLSVHLLGERPTGGGLREIHVTDADHPYGGVWWPPGHSIGWEASLVHELGHFLSAVAGRRSAGPLGATFEDGYRCAVVCDAILEAARTGRRVVVSQ